MSGFNLLGNNSGNTNTIRSLQRLSGTIAANATVLDIPVNETDRSKTFVLMDYLPSSTTIAAALVRNALISNGNLRFLRSNGNSTVNVNATVVELERGNVQFFEIVLPTLTASIDVTVGEFDPNNSFIVSSYTISGTPSSGQAIGYSIQVINSTTIRFINNNLNASKSVNFYVVDLS